MTHTPSKLESVTVENTDGSVFIENARPLNAGNGLNWVDDGDGSVTLNATISSGSGLPANHGTLEDALNATSGSASSASDVASAVEYGIQNYRVFYITKDYIADPITVTSGAGATRICGGGELTWSGSGSGTFLTVENAARLTLYNIRFVGGYRNGNGNVRLADFENCMHLTINNCLFRDNGDPNGNASQPHCLNVLGTKGGLIVNNLVKDTGGKGINVYANGPSGHDDPYFVKVINNEVINTAEECIFTGDEVSSTSSYGKTTYTVRGNHLENNGNQNTFRAAGNSVHNLIFTNNEIYNANDFCAVNIKTGGGTDIGVDTVSHQVTDNQIFLDGGTASNGIYVQSTSGNISATVNDNHLQDTNIRFDSDPQNCIVNGNNAVSIDIDSGSNYTVNGNIADVNVASSASNYKINGTIGTVTTN